ncbi:MAG: PucR family transcriptional regulator ligand-binding domain-containing protein [Firmicutes bacterium]|nr:PucR family transcriptional regulator ligand-binding domain-containing protein [Bacillota bacterium]
MARLTVAKALTLPALRGTRVLAGHDALDRIIDCATVMEVPNVAQWLRGHELLLTSLYALRHDPDRQVKLVADLARVGVSALLIKPKVFVERLPEKMLAEADGQSLPVLELPVETPYIDVLNAVMAEIFRRNSVRRYEADLVDDLLAGAITSPEELRTRAAEVGWDPSGAAVAAVLQVEPPESDPGCETVQQLCDTVVDAVRAIARLRNGIVAGSGSWVRVVFASGRLSVESLAAAARGVVLGARNSLAARRAGPAVSGAIGDPVPSVWQLPESYQAACRHLAVARRVRNSGVVADRRDLGVYALLAPARERPLNPGLVRLLEYDAKGHGQLVKTLRCYLDERGNARRAAARLFVHFKTVQYRMRRIREITGWDLSCPELRLEIEVQLRWLEMAGFGRKGATGPGAG